MRITEDMISTLNAVCPMNMNYRLDEKRGEQRIAVWTDKHNDGTWLITNIMSADQTIERMKLELSYHRNTADTMFRCLKDAGIIVSKKADEKVMTTNRPDLLMRQWKPWECWVMSLLDFRLWKCECHYQAPYGKVVMGGCPKHD